MDLKPLARASIPYILTVGITLGVAGFAGNAFGIQDAVTDAATSVRRNIAQSVLSEDPAEFVATVQPVMREFSGTASATGAQEALASLVEEAERYQTPEKRDAAFHGKLDAYMSTRQGQGVTDFVGYVFERIGADNARTEVIRALAGFSPADRQRAVEVMYGTLDDAQKNAAAQKMGLTPGLATPLATSCPESQLSKHSEQNPELEKLLRIRQAAPAINIDTLVQATTGSLSLLDTYCERGFTGIIGRRDDFAKIADTYCHSP